MSNRKKEQAAVVPPDQPARDSIVRLLDTTMLVEASAGTGKTKSMVDRMIALLREGKCSIGSLAAITFTRKAAAELRARFQIALEKAAHQAEGVARERLSDALDHAERAYIGTIHSFCGRLLRERPVEAGVDPTFLEFDETVDLRLRKEAWGQYVAGMIATDNAVLEELEDVGLEIGQLESAFVGYATYPDVAEWPAPEVELPDLKPVSDELRSYVAHMERLVPTIPVEVGRDTLMRTYQRIARMVRQADIQRPAELLDILSEFGNETVVQKNWPEGRRQGRREKERWQQFVEQHAQPLVEKWRHRRYSVVMRVFKNAATAFEELRRDLGGLNYQDLLLQAAALLRNRPKIREYFRRRFTHLLVDEFQDTDPIQAEVMLLLTADDPKQTDWHRCKPVPGSLFVVGDPKQSIYRFRRADIVTYTDVKRIVKQNGKIVALTTNFRSRKPVIDWVNETFEQVLPGVADKYSPAHCSMIPSRAPDEKENSGVEVLNVPEESGKNAEALAYEADAVAQVIHNASKAKPGDFMIIAAHKKHLSMYAQRLAELGIPSQVTGGALLSEIRQLNLLCLCLEAVTEPDNPVALVAVLRSELFGVSDTALYAFKAAGGRFSFHTRVPEGLPAEVAEPLSDAFSRLCRYDLWLKEFPPVAAVERIVADLGLVASAAAERGGNTLAGGLARAIELLRAAQSTANSISELAEYLRQVVDRAETHDAVPAASPAEAPVRIMNLHQAKGLESPVVFLADPTGAFSHEPQIHIDRSGGPVRGYLAIYGTSSNFHRPLLAYPEQWQGFAVEEGKFLKAEKDRLLYVAATRAGDRLVITQREKGNRRNPWSPLNDHLDGCEDLKVPKVAAPPKTAGVTVGDGDPAHAAKAIGERWRRTLVRSYDLVAAKAISVSGSVPGATAGEHGTEWGTVIHALLEAAMRDPGADLHDLAYASLQHEGLDPALADDAIAVVRSVTASEIWKRAQASDRRLVEVPFQTLMTGDPAEGAGVPALLRGVIDLAFHEPEGWVIVDYKTDARPMSHVPALVAHYRGQVELYAKAWHEMTGKSVAEKGLYFTHVDVYSTV
jgi:ATP-dependent helicase/nuclease subunit A